MTQEELHEARTNPEFLNYLQEKENEAIKSNSLPALYEVLDTLLILDLDEQRIHNIYEKILIEAFNGIENRLKKEEKLDINNDDIFYLRAFYEHAIEKWSYNDFNGAKELFFILSNIVKDPLLQNACAVKMLACDSDEDIESFYDQKVLHQQSARDEKYGYFILDFRFDTQEFLDSNSETLAQLHKDLAPLLGV